MKTGKSTDDSNMVWRFFSHRSGNGRLSKADPENPTAGTGATGIGGDRPAPADHADHRTARPHIGLSDRRNQAPGQRPGPETAVYRRAPTSRRARSFTRSIRRLFRQRPEKRGGRPARSRANLPAAQSRVDRYEELLAEKAVSQQDYDDATAALRQAEADIQYWTGHGGDGPHQPGVYPHHRAHLRAHRPIQCHRRRHRDRLSAGGPGDHPAAGSHLRGCAPVDHRTAAPEAAPGRRPPEPERRQPANGFPDHGGRLTSIPRTGTLQFQDVTVDPSTGSVTLRAVFPNPDGVLLPGMFVQTVIKEGVNQAAILVPQQGVSRDRRGNPMALIVDAESRTALRMLTIDRAVERPMAGFGRPGPRRPGDRRRAENAAARHPGRGAPFNLANARPATATPPAGGSN
jgi:membrane fusion protein (multidrug efflux system)